MMATTSTTEAPILAESLPDLLPFPDRERQRRELVWYLKATLAPDEAESMASSGYRPMPRCGGCRTCKDGYGCNADPVEQVQGSRSGKRASADPRFVRVIVARLGQFDNVLVRRAPAAIKGLPPDERLVVLLELGMGLSQQEVARRLKVTTRTVQRIKERALDRLVGEIWGP